MLLDASVLFLPATRGIDLDGELTSVAPSGRTVVPTSVVRELEALVARGVPGAAVARAVADRYPQMANAGAGDDAIVALAAATGGWVVTVDRDLRDRLHALGLSVVFPRGGRRLDLARGPARARSATVKSRARVVRRAAARRRSDARRR